MAPILSNKFGLKLEPITAIQTKTIMNTIYRDVQTRTFAQGADTQESSRCTSRPVFDVGVLAIRVEKFRLASLLTHSLWKEPKRIPTSLAEVHCPIHSQPQEHGRGLALDRLCRFRPGCIQHRMNTIRLLELPPSLLARRDRLSASSR